MLVRAPLLITTNTLNIIQRNYMVYKKHPINNGFSYLSLSRRRCTILISPRDIIFSPIARYNSTSRGHPPKRIASCYIILFPSRDANRRGTVSREAIFSYIEKHRARPRDTLFRNFHLRDVSSG